MAGRSQWTWEPGHWRQKGRRRPYILIVFILRDASLPVCGRGSQGRAQMIGDASSSQASRDSGQGTTRTTGSIAGGAGRHLPYAPHLHWPNRTGREKSVIAGGGGGGPGARCRSRGTILRNSSRGCAASAEIRRRVSRPRRHHGSSGSYQADFDRGEVDRCPALRSSVQSLAEENFKLIPAVSAINSGICVSE